ncbi:MAG: LD-carboxypeptidase [Neisseria sp.]|nr:LD-carboxypeptidase [Neisseria sp.]
MSIQLTRRQLLGSSTAIVGTSLLQACTTPSSSPSPTTATSPQPSQIMPTHSRHNPNSSETVLRIIASSGFGGDYSRNETAFSRLHHAGFTVTNQQAAYRRHQRFAGTDAERITDFQDIVQSRTSMPKVIMAYRGGYGAQRLLPHIDFASLGAKMREHGTLFFGFSDVCALQLALLAKGKMLSFAGPMVYSEFGKPQPSTYTMNSFIQGTTNPQNTITVSTIQRSDVNTDGILWGGNLSVLAALSGSPYLPDIKGGILFLEDVGEQPYRIERMLQTLLLAGILQKQKAIVMGDFRMSGIRDVYDSSYDFSTVAHTISRAAKIPVLSGFPFGHISNKATFPLGAHAAIRSTSDGGYSITFNHYPTLNKTALNLDFLLPQSDAATIENNISEEKEP